MVIEWKEREHSEEDKLAMENERCMEALRDCGVKKIFMTPCLRAQPELLQYLISIWDEDQEKFTLRDQELEIDFSNSYFIIGLSQRGDTPVLTSTRPTMENMSMVINMVCPGAQKGSGSGKLDIQIILDLALKVVLHTITQVAGSQAPHEAKKTHLLLVIDFLTSTIFNSAKAMTINMKR